ncbi:secreted RxLR effector protein 161-like [Pyrus communis]|uniref:secreted RxLR effector protein 161-like n=1 Tax=Pyrus communis TaxID=23211 RepID=UPI0035C1BDF7
MYENKPFKSHKYAPISRFVERPTELHLKAAKRVLRYLKGTVNFGLVYKKGGEEELFGYTDSDYAGDQDDRKSTSGYVFMLSSGAVFWSLKKQPMVTLSTTEAEFIAAASSACKAVWLRRILRQLNHDSHKFTTISCDNSSTIKLSNNPVMHGCSKHIDVRFHFLRELTKDEVVELTQCSSQE